MLRMGSERKAARSEAGHSKASRVADDSDIAGSSDHDSMDMQSDDECDRKQAPRRVDSARKGDKGPPSGMKDKGEVEPDKKFSALAFVQEKARSAKQVDVVLMEGKGSKSVRSRLEGVRTKPSETQVEQLGTDPAKLINDLAKADSDLEKLRSTLESIQLAAWDSTVAGAEEKMEKIIESKGAPRRSTKRWSSWRGRSSKSTSRRRALSATGGRF